MQFGNVQKACMEPMYAKLLNHTTAILILCPGYV